VFNRFGADHGERNAQGLHRSRGDEYLGVAASTGLRLSRASEKRWPGALVLDVTSKRPDPWARFSPFYSHGGIPIPNTPNQVAASVEGLWQGLKVFETEDIDPSRWAIIRMRGGKRPGRSRAAVRGQRRGVGGGVLLDYRDARYAIYLPAYRWVLENRLAAEVGRLTESARGRRAVLLDYETNGDADDLSSPLSHAALVKCFVEGSWPNGGEQIRAQDDARWSEGL
jgi:hypothetical protein